MNNVMKKLLVIAFVVMMGIPIPTYPPLPTSTVLTHGGGGYPGCPR